MRRVWDTGIKYPGHVARVALFLAADDSDGMTGQHVLVDAGLAQQSVIA